MKKLKVFIVDDSAVVRQVLTEIITSDSTMEVDSAADPIFAQKHIDKNGWPDVMILDIEMPRKDGITYLKEVMATHPIPVVMCSTLTEQGATISMKAMSLGAVSIITKPKLGIKDFLGESAQMFLSIIKSASYANVKTVVSNLNTIKSISKVPEKLSADVIESKKNFGLPSDKIIAIGTSTGGTIALESVLTKLDSSCKGLAIVQHMPAGFTAAFAERLNSICEIEVREAKDGDIMQHGLALICPGEKHMQVVQSSDGFSVEIKDGPKVNRHKPSVDVLFRSVARQASGNALGIIMTGMGDDGARGLLEMREAGCETIAQDKNSSIVYGMPMEAMKINAAQKEESLMDIPKSIMEYK